MPIFEYSCEACQATFERLTLRAQATEQIACPQCASTDTHKVFSTFSTQASAGAGVPGTAGNSAFR